MLAPKLWKVPLEAEERRTSNVTTPAPVEPASTITVARVNPLRSIGLVQPAADIAVELNAVTYLIALVSIPFNIIYLLL
jgi:hypothetical protein